MPSSFCFGYFMAHLPPDQFTLQIHFDTSPEHHERIFSDVLTIFDMETVECEINNFLYPMLTNHNRMLAPAIESMPDYWAAWDDPITEDQRLHIAVLDIPLYSQMLQSARACGFAWTFGNPPLGNELRTVLEVHLVPNTELIELFGRLYGGFRRQQQEIHELQTALRETRNLLGRTIEALASRDQSLAGELGLLLRPEDLQ